jgi:hypothetical protein
MIDLRSFAIDNRNAWVCKVRDRYHDSSGTIPLPYIAHKLLAKLDEDGAIVAALYYLNERTEFSLHWNDDNEGND